MNLNQNIHNIHNLVVKNNHLDIVDNVDCYIKKHEQPLNQLIWKKKLQLVLKLLYLSLWSAALKICSSVVLTKPTPNFLIIQLVKFSTEKLLYNLILMFFVFRKLLGIWENFKKNFFCRCFLLDKMLNEDKPKSKPIEMVTTPTRKLSSQTNTPLSKSPQVTKK